MDILLLAFTSFFFLRGFLKGFLSTVLSLVGVSVVAFAAWQLSRLLGDISSDWFNFVPFFENLINSKIPGTFSSMGELEAAAKNTGLLYVFLLKIIGGVSFEGELSAGEIIAPKLNLFANKLIVFAIIFVVLCVFVKMLSAFLQKFLNCIGLGFANKLLGGVVGGVEGILLSMIVFFVLSVLGNFLLNESLIKFVGDGVVSNWIYQNVIIKSINLLF